MMRPALRGLAFLSLAVSLSLACSREDNRGTTTGTTTNVVTGTPTGTRTGTTGTTTGAGFPLGSALDSESSLKRLTTWDSDGFNAESLTENVARLAGVYEGALSRGAVPSTTAFTPLTVELTPLTDRDVYYGVVHPRGALDAGVWFDFEAHLRLKTENDWLAESFDAECWLRTTGHSRVELRISCSPVNRTLEGSLHSDEGESPGYVMIELDTVEPYRDWDSTTEKPPSMDIVLSLVDSLDAVWQGSVFAVGTAELQPNAGAGGAGGVGGAGGAAP